MPRAVSTATIERTLGLLEGQFAGIVREIRLTAEQLNTRFDEIANERREQRVELHNLAQRVEQLNNDFQNLGPALERGALAVDAVERMREVPARVGSLERKLTEHETQLFKLHVDDWPGKFKTVMGELKTIQDFVIDKQAQSKVIRALTSRTTGALGALLAVATLVSVVAGLYAGWFPRAENTTFITPAPVEGSGPQ